MSDPEIPSITPKLAIRNRRVPTEPPFLDKVEVKPVPPPARFTELSKEPSQMPVNRTVVRGVATVVVGLLAMVGVLPEEARETIVDNAETAFGAVTVLWGVVATVKGALKR